MNNFIWLNSGNKHYYVNKNSSKVYGWVVASETAFDQGMRSYTVYDTSINEEYIDFYTAQEAVEDQVKRGS